MKFETEITGEELDKVQKLSVQLARATWTSAGSLRGASRICRKHIELWGLGASAMAEQWGNLKGEAR